MKHQNQTNKKWLFSESEGTGISKALLLMILLLTSSFTFANSIHLYNSIENDEVLIGLLFESETGKLTQIKGTIEKGVFQGISSKVSHDISSPSINNTLLKSSDDGTGGESSDDGTGGHAPLSIISFTLNCENQNQTEITLEYADGSSEQLTGELTLNGQVLSCSE